MSAIQLMAGRLMRPEIATKTWVTKGGKQVSLKQRCPPHLPNLYRRSLVEAEITQSRTILNNDSNCHHRATRSAPTRALTVGQQLAGDMQNPNILKTSGLLQAMDGQKTMSRVTRMSWQMRMTCGRQTMDGIVPIAVGVNNLIPRHGNMLYLRIPLIPEQHRMCRRVDGKVGVRRREDYPR